MSTILVKEEDKVQKAVSIELSKYHIDYRPRMAIKAQALTNFIAKLTYDVAPNHEIVVLEEHDQDGDVIRWKLFVDGSSNQHG